MGGKLCQLKSLLYVGQGCGGIMLILVILVIVLIVIMVIVVIVMIIIVIICTGFGEFKSLAPYGGLARQGVRLRPFRVRSLRLALRFLRY